MSASGKWPGPPNGAHLRRRSNCSRKRRPVVPEIVADAPHVGVAHHVLGRREDRFTGRQAEHHGAAGAVDGRAHRLDLRLVVEIGPAQVIHLHEIDAPGGDQREDRIVVLLGPGLRSCRRRTCRCSRGRRCCRSAMSAGVVRRALDRRVLRHRLARNSAHEVQAELQTLAMDIVGERLESAPRSPRRETGWSPAAAAPTHPCTSFAPGPVIEARRVRLVPLDVDGDDTPIHSARAAPP